MVSAADTATTVGLSGSVELTFDVVLDATTSGPVTVGYATADGTAVAGRDYVPASGTLSFPAGTTARSVMVTVLPDVGAEPDETFTLELSDPVGASVATTSATAVVRHFEGAVPAPVLTGVSPGTVGVGATPRQVTLTGANFHSTSVVAVTGTGVVVVSTQVVDAGTIRVTLSAWTTVLPGVRDVSVTSPGRGASTCVGCLTVTPAPRALTAGPSLGHSATERRVTITGSQFTDGAVAAIRGGTGVQVLSTTVLRHDAAGRRARDLGGRSVGRPGDQPRRRDVGLHRVLHGPVRSDGAVGGPGSAARSNAPGEHPGLRFRAGCRRDRAARGGLQQRRGGGQWSDHRAGHGGPESGAGRQPAGHRAEPGLGRLRSEHLVLPVDHRGT
ncbi:MAG: hypothetical protein H0T85_11900, partial [Geodermatophilaceae bacterium]|nr:hypothetical protein [Geodermatophilaceae bacterium]